MIVITALIFFASCSGGGHKSSRGGGAPSGGTGTGTSTGTGTGGGGGNGGGSAGEYVPGTDKWHVNFDEAALQQAIQSIGLSESTSEIKTMTINVVCQCYSGLSISFSTEPVADGSAPPEGSSRQASQLLPKPYNVMAVHGGSNGGAIGMSQSDMSGQNAMVENNSGQALGVFVLQLANAHWTGGADVFTRNLASTIAHEIGHSLGLSHCPASGYIMSGVLAATGEELDFHPNSRAALEQVLPGPNRDN